jgi:hypothetical protein
MLDITTHLLECSCSSVTCRLNSQCKSGPVVNESGVLHCVQQLSALELVNQMQASVANSFCGDSEMALPVTWLKTNQTQSTKCLRRETF